MASPVFLEILLLGSVFMYLSVSLANFIIFLFISFCITLILIFTNEFKLFVLVGGSLYWALLFDLYDRGLVLPVWILSCLWNHCFENLEVSFMHSTISLVFFCYCFKENLSLCLYTPSKKSNKGSNDDNDNTSLYMTLFSFS